MRARVLYVPLFIAAEADRFTQIAGDWAEVESFDVPADNPVDAAQARLDELGWDECALVVDGYAQALGVDIALHEPGRFRAVAVGHAAPRYTVQPPRPTLHPDVVDAASTLLDSDYMAFWRAVTQITQGGMPDAWVERWAASVSKERVREFFSGIVETELPACERLAGFDGPLLLAQHVDCVLWTAEGFEDAVAALPDARIIRCKEIPVFDPAFGETLRELAAG